MIKFITNNQGYKNLKPMKPILFFLLFLLLLGLESCHENYKCDKIEQNKVAEKQKDILLSLFNFQKQRVLLSFSKDEKPEKNKETLLQFYQYLKLKSNLQQYLLTNYNQKLGIQNYFELEKADNFNLQMFAIRLRYIKAPQNAKLQKLIKLNKKLLMQVNKRREEILENLSKSK